MKEILTAIGSTYAITSKNGCTVTYPNGDPIIEVPAGQQTLFIAQSSSILVSDEEARVTACGGSATLNFTSAAPSILSEGGSTGGLTANERALLMGAAQRGGDNTFSAANTFTGEVDMSVASVTPPEGWNVGALTAEAVQAVVPIAWDDTSVTFGSGTNLTSKDSAAIGNNSNSDEGGIALGASAKSGTYGVALGAASVASNSGNSIGVQAQSGAESVAVGNSSNASGTYSTAIGNRAKTPASYSVALGSGANGSVARNIAIGYNANATQQTNAIVIGAKFEDTSGKYECKTEGTGSITIGAGANTLNNGSTESSNSVTIGCKAENKGADSVVIGAQAKGTNKGIIVIGTKATAGSSSLLIGTEAKSSFEANVSIGHKSEAYAQATLLGNLTKGAHSSCALGYASNAAMYAIALGHAAKANAEKTIAIGKAATASDLGATVIRSTASDGTYTQLYFSGANTPLANTYHDGAPMLGYVTKDSAGNIVAAGTRSLIDLLTDNSTFAPASLDENGEWVMPKVFHPSDLDMPNEEPSEPEEYQPLPVWPIVEPEIEEEI